MDFGLDRIRAVAEELDRPDQATPAILIAGTNGKGSTAALLHALYGEAGYNVGLYTSPHLLSLRERVRIGDDFISREEMIANVSRVRGAADRLGVGLTFFEIITLVAFCYFRERRAELAIIEVGLGGRLDATNIVRAITCVITGVALDHQEFLGDDVASVAAEKAGILRAGVPLVSGPLEPAAREVIAGRVEELGVPWSEFGRDFGFDLSGDSERASRMKARGLRGVFQERNAAVAVAVCDALQRDWPVTDDERARALASVHWPGRFEELDARPRVLVDAAHNAEAAAVLAEELDRIELPRPRVLVFGVMGDKDWRAMLASLAPSFDRIVCVPVKMDRAADPQHIRDGLVADGYAESAVEVAEEAVAGFRIARDQAGDHGAVVVTGSIFLIAEIYEECGGKGLIGDGH